ncbi:relaxase domain-containing protein [Oxalobacter vibrioformis]|uniref:Relaxase domain-containing protein n=1 Tax=Oxalobacter vibrioformis TaxID=933080 RepID=A0A9E9LY73_9BURK|nr:MobF family relaxase [Oxalobacter vibrioformis]WAW10862.1 relaxase domain-containing protein [Oxalobacter vibrioformis]
MMSISQKSAAGAEHYYLHMQERSGKIEEYYSREGAGEWHGAGAEKLGLSGEVAAEDFRQMVRGFDPKTGEAMTQNAGADNRRAGWDCTLSAPKSVSAAWAVASDSDREKIEAAHKNAVAAALDIVQEKAAYTRTGAGSVVHEKAEIIIASFDHFTSRAVEPQLHTHNFIFNASIRADGTVGAIESRYLYQWQKVAGTVYQSELARGLEKIGYTTSKDGDEFIKLSVVPESLCDAWSSRRAAIETELEKRGATSARAAEVAALGTREAKQKNHDAHELRQRWQAEAKEHNFTTENVQSGPEIVRPDVDPAGLADTGLKGATELDSLVTEKDLYLSAARQSLDSAGGKAQIEKVVAEMKSQAIEMVRDTSFQSRDGRTIDREEIKYTTREILEAERFVLNNSLVRMGEGKHVLPAETVRQAVAEYQQRKGFELTDDQLRSIEHIAHGRDGVGLIIGDAGTGKSTMSEVVKKAFESEGFTVLGAAPSNKAARGLQESSGIRSQTIDRLLIDIENNPQKIDSKTVILLDEAGMVGSLNAAALQKAADQAGAKLVYLGDNKQLPSVAAGGMFSRVAEQCGYERLDTNMRQREAEHKQAVTQMSRGEAAEAMKFYVEKGNVCVEATYRAAVEKCAESYLSDRAKVGANNTICLASTNKQVDDINSKIRENLKEQGELGREKEYQIGKDAQPLSLAVGDRIIFNEKHKESGALKADTATVRAHAENGQILIERDGRQQTVDPSSIEIKHGYASTTHKAQGATLERATVFSSAQTSREMAYVQASRAREETTFVFTSHTIREMEKQAQPTPELIEKAERAAARQGQELPESARESFYSAKQYLIDNGIADLRVRDANEMRLEAMRETLDAMAQSRQKETTHDFTPRDEFEKARLANEKTAETIEKKPTEKEVKEPAKTQEKTAAPQKETAAKDDFTYSK